MTTNKFLSRRALLGGAAVTGSALALQACGDDVGPVVPNPDIPPLNGLLAAEYGAIAAYTAGIPMLEMPATGDPLASSGFVIGAIARAWQTQHREHAAQLAATVTAIGGTPVAENSITFTAPTPEAEAPSARRSGDRVSRVTNSSREPLMWSRR